MTLNAIVLQGTRAARALLAEFERDARAADFVRDLGVDDVE
jgi:hypothetical protein